VSWVRFFILFGVVTHCQVLYVYDHSKSRQTSSAVRGSRDTHREISSQLYYLVSPFQYLRLHYHGKIFLYFGVLFQGEVILPNTRMAANGLDNSGDDPLKVPRFGGLPFCLELEPTERFGHGAYDWIQSPNRTARELCMPRFMAALTERPDWNTLVFEDHVIAMWREEALENPHFIWFGSYHVRKFQIVYKKIMRKRRACCSDVMMVCIPAPSQSTEVHC
jgi:Protein of unknown function (DUF4246)